ncbi:general secretion pathway protein GspB [Motilimonas pumila]|uniref:Type II secretion system protein GspB C-terminal domain-containing protein n=1 Tax=Motilimonas pumila TaxID=2303987 RepID=A0A418YAU6_9GAMM|nr:general secretion pathway protein GspB [Motilimonas pumila]RJG40088.1 hypothetical protein D1Z90_17195 [Motilimonas pumila]
MSTILNALKKSEELRNETTPMQSLARGQAQYQFPVSEDTGPAIWPYVLSGVLTTAIIAGGIIWYISSDSGSVFASLPAAEPTVAELQTEDNTSVVNQAGSGNSQASQQKKSVRFLEQEVAAGGDEIAFLPAKEYKTVPLPEYSAPPKPAFRVGANVSDLVQDIPKEPVTVSGQKDDILGDIDLSGTDPALAAKIRAALAVESPATNVTETVPSNNVDYSDVSAELARKFQKALDSNIPLDQEPEPVAATAGGGAMDITQLPDDLQQLIRPFSYNSHVYSSNSSKKSVSFNNKKYREGDEVSNGLEVIEIRPNDVVLRINRQSFKVSAMTDWRGY